MTQPEKTDDNESQFTARNAVKKLVFGLVSYKVTVITANLATNYTGFDKDDMIVKVGSPMVGWGVAANAQPYTDKLVDASFDYAAKRYENYKTNRAAKKAAEETDEKKD